MKIFPVPGSDTDFRIAVILFRIIPLSGNFIRFAHLIAAALPFNGRGLRIRRIRQVHLIAGATRQKQACQTQQYVYFVKSHQKSHLNLFLFNLNFFFRFVKLVISVCVIFAAAPERQNRYPDYTCLSCSAADNRDNRPAAVLLFAEPSESPPGFCCPAVRLHQA